jgi:hypothetical protein
MTMRKDSISLRLILAFLLTLFILARTSNSRANDVTASSCSASDIQSAIDTCISTGGGTVTLPACDYTNSWSGSDSVYKDVGSTPLRIIGRGISNTKIGYANDQTRSWMWEFKGIGFKEFAHIYLEGNPSISTYAISVAFIIREAENCRIHHIETNNFRGPTALLCSTSNLGIDHCTFGDVLYDTTYQFYVYDTANVAWSDDWPGYFGTVNYNVFFEDNQIGGAHHPVSLFEKAKVVFRYNKVTIPKSAYGPSGGYQGNLDSHSPGFGSCDGDGISDAQSYEHGGQAYEIYRNKFTRTDVTPPNTAGYAIRIRSGAAIITNNTFENTYYATSLVLESHNIGGNCDSEHGYPQDHDFGPGTGGCTASDGCCDKIEHIYIWDNNYTNVDTEVLIEDITGGGLSDNVDYFLRAPTQQQDAFTWTPYIYPHPLVTTDNWPPDPPKNLRIIESESF